MIGALDVSGVRAAGNRAFHTAWVIGATIAALAVAMSATAYAARAPKADAGGGGVAAKLQKAVDQYDNADFESSAKQAAVLARVKGPTQHPAELLAGKSYLALGEAEHAIPYLKAAIAAPTWEGSAEAEYRLAVAYKAVGAKDLAAFEFQKYLAFFPQDQRVQRARDQLATLNLLR